MTFADFVKVYREDRGLRLKESTFTMKDNIIDTKSILYFGTGCMSVTSWNLWEHQTIYTSNCWSKAGQMQ
jgi:hypothetical protein